MGVILDCSSRKGYRHGHGTDFKVRLVQASLAGEGTIKGLARQYGIYHSLLRPGAGKRHKGDFDEKEAVRVLKRSQSRSLRL